MQGRLRREYFRKDEGAVAPFCVFTEDERC